MAEITASLVKELREKTGAGMMDCKKALGETQGYLEKAVDWLRTNAPDRALHHPIPDLTAPAADEMAALIDELYARLRAGESLVINCGAGIGRTGTIATALLMRCGVSLEDALETVRANRPMAGPETGPQSDVLRVLKTRWSTK